MPKTKSEPKPFSDVRSGGLQTGQIRTRIYRLAEGESLRDPSTTSGRRVHGPAQVTWRDWPDGGIDVKVEDLPNAGSPWPAGANADPDADWKDA